MTDTQTTQRLALLFSPSAAHAHWVTLDQTGQPPRIIDEVGVPRFELVSLDDAPLAIYRADTEESYDRLALAALAELVRIVDGEPNVSVDVDERMRELRDQLRHTVANATETFDKYELQIAKLEHKNESIVGEARRWKAKAEQRAIFIESWKDENTKLSEVARERDAAASGWEVEATQRRALNETLAAEIDRLNGVTVELTAQIVDAQANALRTIDRISAALPEPIIPAEIEPVFDIELFYGTDDVPVVEISTRRVPGRVRVNLNDGVIWDGDPEEDERPGKHAERLPHEQPATDSPDVMVTANVGPDGVATLSVDQREHQGGVRFVLDGVPVDGSGDRETISRQLDTIRDQAEKISELEEQRAECATNLSQVSAERAEAWRDLDTTRTERDEANNMRRKLDMRLAEERDTYVASSKALHTVIERYADLAEYGANLARHSKAIGRVFTGTYSDTAVELAQKYLEEHEKLIR